MDRFLKTVSFLALLALVIWWRHWTSLFHVLCGGVIAAFFLAAWFAWRRNRLADDTPAPADEGETAPLHAVLVGALGAAVLVAVLAAGFAGLAGTPVYGWFYDRDRAALSDRIVILDQAGNHQELCRILTNRLTLPASAAWRHDLAQQLFHQQIVVAETPSAPAEQLPLLGQALATAQTYGLDAALAETRRHDAQRAADTLERLLALERDGNWSQLATEARVLLATSDSPWMQDRMARLLHHGILELAKAEPLPAEQLKLIDQARAMAVKYRWPTDLEDSLAAQVRAEQNRREADARAQAEQDGLQAARQQAEAQISDAQAKLNAAQTDKARLEASAADQTARAQDLEERLAKEHAAALAEKQALTQAQAEAERRHQEELAQLLALEHQRQAALQPRDLPPGVRADFVAARPDGQAFLALEFFVEDANGKPVVGLEAKDLSWVVGGKSAVAVLSAAAGREPEPDNITFLMDTSGSMQGAALQQAIKGARQIIAATSSPTSVRIVSFDTKIHQICPWTQDLKEASRRFDDLRADGDTAIYDALASATDDLRNRPGRKKILLFSDGADNHSRTALDAVIGSCKATGVQVHTIGLSQGALDSASLRKIAAATGGGYQEAATIDQLVAAFEHASKNLLRLTYQARVKPADTLTATAEVELTIGGKNAVTIVKHGI